MRVKKQKGFSILAVILVIVAVIVAIGVWALSGQSNTNDSNKRASISASSLISESSSIKLAFDKIIINGDGVKSSITYMPGVPDKSNILDPSDGLSLSNGGDALIEDTDIKNFVFSKKVAVTGAGSNSKYDAVILLAGVKDAVCREVNHQMNGVALDFPIPAFEPLGGFREFIVGASASNPNSNVQLDFSTVVALRNLNWANGGCIKGASNSEGNNVFYRVLASDID